MKFKVESLIRKTSPELPVCSESKMLT